MDAPAWASVPALLADSAQRHADREAVVDDDVTLTFDQLGAAVNEAARALIGTGIQRDDRVAIWAPNIHEWVVAAFGALSVGGVLVPLNTRFKGHEAGYILAKSRARLLFTVTGFLDTDYVALLRAAHGDASGDRPVRDLPDLERVVVLRGEAPEGTQTWADVLAGASEVDADVAVQRAAAVGPDDLCDLMFTSGTTGRPKGVMTSHRQTLRVFEVWSRLVGLRAGDRYLIVNPFFHTFGYKAGLLAAVMRGATIVPHAVFDARSLLEKVAAQRITVLPGPPALYQSLLAHPDLDAHDRASLRLAVTGAAVIPLDLVERMRDVLGFATVLTAYGLTEATGVVTMCRPDDDAQTITRTSGCAIPDTEVRVVDADGAEVPRGEPGEVLVRGYNVMRGYFEDPEQTAVAIDADGWLHTGDIGVMDQRGYVRITDRTKDMFIVGGFNAYPAEIENELLAHPQVAQAAVVGMPDERLGEVGAAFVVAKPGEHIVEDDLIAWARDRMANFKVPRHVEVVEALPMNASGKVLKHELRARVRA